MLKLSSKEHFSIKRYNSPQYDNIELLIIAGTILNDNGISSLHIYSNFDTEEEIKKFISMIFHNYAKPDNLKDMRIPTRKYTAAVDSSMFNELISMLPSDSFEDLSDSKHTFRYGGKYSIEFKDDAAILVLEVEVNKSITLDSVEQSIQKNGAVVRKNTETTYTTKWHTAIPHKMKLCWQKDTYFTISNSDI
jgi:hypothetical protein